MTLKLVGLAALALIAWWWLRRPAKPPVRFDKLLDAAEARAILGVGADAGPEAIRAAHRRLIAAVHPDRGGSADLARRINLARDVLLNRGTD